MKTFVKMKTTRDSFRCYPVGSPLDPEWTRFFDVRFEDDSESCPDGWLDYETTNEKPEVGVGVTVGYDCEVDGGVMRKTYVAVRVPRTFSKLKIYAALARRGKWNRLVEWMKGISVDGMSVKTAFDLANELNDTHPLFESMLGAAKEAIGVSDAEADEILSESEGGA